MKQFPYRATLVTKKSLQWYYYRLATVNYIEINKNIVTNWPYYFEARTHLSFKQSFPRKVQALMNELKSWPISSLSFSLRTMNFRKKFISFATEGVWTP